MSNAAAAAAALAGLPDSAQKELAQFVENEQRRANFQQSVHTFTDMCWDSCNIKTTSRSGATLDRSESTCMANCVERFLDTSLAVIQKFNETARGGRSKSPLA